MLILVLMC